MTSPTVEPPYDANMMDALSTKPSNRAVLPSLANVFAFSASSVAVWALPEASVERDLAFSAVVFASFAVDVAIAASDFAQPPN